MTEANQVAVRESDPAELSTAGFQRLARFITNELGIKMPESKLTMVQSRLMRRVRELRLESVDRYCEYFLDSANSEEREHFINAITTNKTDFYREPEHFSFLCDVVLPAARRDENHAGRRFHDGNAGNAGRRFNVWSAGCSSGEEPYTLAMVLAEFASAQREFDFAILATDVSTKVLASAQNGIYQESQVLPVPPEVRRKYLLRGRDRKEGLVRVIPELRRRVSFHRLNFMDDDYAIKDMFDAIFFRNVMIYFDRSTQQAVINKMCRHLAPGGYLFAGHSESLAGLDVPLRPLKASVYRKPESREFV